MQTDQTDIFQTPTSVVARRYHRGHPWPPGVREAGYAIFDAERDAPHHTPIVQGVSHRAMISWMNRDTARYWCRDHAADEADESGVRWDRVYREWVNVDLDGAPVYLICIRIPARPEVYTCSIEFAKKDARARSKVIPHRLCVPVASCRAFLEQETWLTNLLTEMGGRLTPGDVEVALAHCDYVPLVEKAEDDGRPTGPVRGPVRGLVTDNGTDNG